MPIPQVAEVRTSAELVRFYWCRSCTELFAFVGNPGRLAAGFAWDVKRSGWRVFRVKGTEQDLAPAVAAVAEVGPPR
jgi:hypothetical protein